MNNGSGDFLSPFAATNSPSQDLGSGNVRFADFNGDGLGSLGSSSNNDILYLSNFNEKHPEVITISNDPSSDGYYSAIQKVFAEVKFSLSASSIIYILGPFSIEAFENSLIKSLICSFLITLPLGLI